MKKALFLMASLMWLLTLQAQVVLNGNGFSQSFDSLSFGLPLGWSVVTNASSNSLGTDVSATKYTATPGTGTYWGGATGGFKNVASADSFANYAAATNALQTSAMDRAIGIRQVSQTSTTFPGSDSGAGFVLQLLNTTGYSSFTMSFKLQSLDPNQSRVTTWLVDYGTGTNPTSFTNANALGTLTTGGSTFSNTTITVNFGTALDNLTGPVFIRILTLSTASGTGSRTTSAIDDVSLNFIGLGTPNYRPVLVGISPSDNVGNVPTATNRLLMTFDRKITKGTGAVILKNETDQDSVVKNVSGSDVTVSGSIVTVSNLTLLAGKAYNVRFDSTAFDTAGYLSYGIYDTTAWNFYTVPAPITVNMLNENFGISCTNNVLPLGWERVSAVGAQIWNCSAYGYNNTPAIQISGYQSGAHENEDWLISPRIDLSNSNSDDMVSFRAYKNFQGPDIQLLISNNYDGGGIVSNALWIPINIDFSGVDTNWKQFTGFIGSYTAAPLHIAFKYTSTSTAAATWKLDDIRTGRLLSIPSHSRTSLPLTVIGASSANSIVIAFQANSTEGLKLTVTDLSGRMMYAQAIATTALPQRFEIDNLHLTPGMYFIGLENSACRAVVKAVVQ